MVPEVLAVFWVGTGNINSQVRPWLIIVHVLEGQQIITHSNRKNIKVHGVGAKVGEENILTSSTFHQGVVGRPRRHTAVLQWCHTVSLAPRSWRSYRSPALEICQLWQNRVKTGLNWWSVMNCSCFYQLPKIHERIGAGRPAVSARSLLSGIISWSLDDGFQPIVQSFYLKTKKKKKKILQILRQKKKKSLKSSPLHFSWISKACVESLLTTTDWGPENTHVLDVQLEQAPPTGDDQNSR